MTTGKGRGGSQGNEGEGSSPGTCIKGPWTKTTVGRTEFGRWGVGRAGERNGGKWGQL